MNPASGLAGLLLAAALAVPAPVVAADDGVDEKLIAAVHREARADLLAGLEKHAKWCGSARLFLERDEVWRRILEVDPDHEKARKGLGYRRNRDGTWKDPDPDRKVSKNYSQAKLKTAGPKLSEALAPYTIRIFAFFDEHEDAFTREQRRRLLDGILTVDPENERAHLLLDHVRRKKGWVLAETVRAEARRRELGDLVRGLIRSAPKPEPSEPNALERKLAIDWSVVLATPRFRVVGTVEPDEAVRAIRALHVAEEYFNAVFGTSTEFETGYTLFLLGDPAEKDALIDNFPWLTASQRELLKTFDGTGFPDAGGIGHWGSSRIKRIDGIVRIALGYLFAKELGIGTNHAWAYEGFGLYMTYEIVRTRLNWYTVPTEGVPEEEGQAVRARLVHPESSWMQEADRVLRSDRRPALRTVLGKGANAFTTEELLLAYVVAAFLIETRPEETPAILRKIGGGMGSGAVLAKTLGMGLDDVEVRILRWLSERR